MYVSVGNDSCVWPFLQETCKIFKAESKIMNMKIVCGRAVGQRHNYGYLHCQRQQNICYTTSLGNYTYFS